MNISNQIEAALKNYLHGFDQKDWTTLTNLLSDDFVYFTDKCIIQDKKAFLDFMSKDDWKSKGYEITDINVSPSQNGDMALAAYKTRFWGMSGGQEMALQATESTIFKKEGSDWKIIHSHTSNKF